MTPAFDSAAFTQLAEDLGSYSDATEFVRSFTALLPARIERIEQALMTQDREETITALLSLQASAAMAGATQLYAATTHALAANPVERAPRGPLIRKLQGQADLFRQASAGLNPQILPSTEDVRRESRG
jgi:HPt (histidine-containing phosphotransfer) domain-containing protein